VIYKKYENIIKNNLNFEQYSDNGSYRDIIDMNCYDFRSIENIIPASKFYMSAFKVNMFFVNSDMYYIANIICRFDKIISDSIIEEKLVKKTYELRCKLLNSSRLNVIKKGHFLVYKYMYDNNIEWADMQKIITNYNKLLHLGAIFDLNTHTQNNTPEGLLFSILPGFFNFAILHNEPEEKHKNFANYMSIIKARKAKLFIFTNLDIEKVEKIYYSNNITKSGEYVIIK